MNASPSLVRAHYDVARVRADFPLLARSIQGKPLVYLDSAASSQRPLAVLRAVEHYETTLHANVHRGVHSLSQWATDAYERSRDTVRRFLNARSSREIVFVRGTTEAINLVANSWGRRHLKAGDEVLITYLEHHANIVPWQMVCAATGAHPAGGADHRHRRARYGGVPRNAEPAHETGGGRTRLQRTRHGAAGAGDRAVGACARRAGSAGRCAGGGARHRGCAGTGLRFLRFLGPQGLRPHGHRRALWPRVVAGGHAAVAGRRRDDPVGHHRSVHLQRAAREIRGRHPQHLGGSRVWARRSNTWRNWTRSHCGARARIARAHQPNAWRRCRACA